MDIFTACYSENGDVIWARGAGGIWHEHAYEIVHDGGDGLYVLGTFLSPVINFEDVSLINTGNYDAFLARYDTEGNILWARNPTGGGQEDAWSLAVDSQGMIYIAGSYRSPTLTFENHTLTNTSDDFDLYLVKYEPTGRPLWVQSAAGQDGEDANAIAIDQRDDLYLTGYFKSDTLSFDTTHLYLSNHENLNVDMYLAKFDQDGQVIWATSSSGSAWAYPKSACVWGADKLAVMGTFTGCNFGDTEYFDYQSVASNGSYDIFLVNYDQAGNALFAENYGGQDMDFGQDACRDRDGHLFLGAFFSSDSLSIGPATLLNKYNNKMLVAKRLNPDLTPVPSPEADPGATTRPISMLNRPNPFNPSTTIAFELPSAQLIKLDIYDLTGRHVRALFRGWYGHGQHSVAWDGRDQEGAPLAAGLYFCRLQLAGQHFTHKMTLVK
jgi:hypothetical protein